MREVQKTVYQSFDGKAFDSAKECREYERDNIHLGLVGLTAEQIEAALDRSDVALGDAIEAVAYRIRQTRVAAGDLKRERRKPDAEPTAAEPAAADEPEPESMTEADMLQGVSGTTLADMGTNDEESEGALLNDDATV